MSEIIEDESIVKGKEEKVPREKTEEPENVTCACNFQPLPFLLYAIFAFPVIGAAAAIVVCLSLINKDWGFIEKIEDLSMSWGEKVSRFVLSCDQTAAIRTLSSVLLPGPEVFSSVKGFSVWVLAWVFFSLPFLFGDVIFAVPYFLALTTLIAIRD